MRTLKALNGILIMMHAKIIISHNQLYFCHSTYSGTPLNGHPSTADTCNIMDNSECPDCISIDFNILKPPQ